MQNPGNKVTIIFLRKTMMLAGVNYSSPGTNNFPCYIKFCLA